MGMTVSRPRRSRRRGRVTVRRPSARVARARATSTGTSRGITRSNRPFGRSRHWNEHPGARAAGPALARHDEAVVAVGDLQRLRGQARHLDHHDQPASRLEDVHRRAPLAARQVLGAVEEGEPVEELVHLLLQQGERRGRWPPGRRSRCHRLASEHDQRPVVGGPGPGLEALDVAEDRVLQRGGVEAALLDDEGAQRLLAVLLAVRVPGLGDAVGVDEQGVPGVASRTCPAVVAARPRTGRAPARPREGASTSPPARTRSGGLWPAFT